MALRPGIKVADRFEVRRVEREAPAYQACRAFDAEAKSEVALWLVRPELLPGEGARMQFVEDTQRARAFFHLNVRRIYAGGEDPRGCWVTLPILGGQTLAQTIRGGRPIKEEGLVKLCRALGDGLDAAASVQLVHGRLLPADIRIADVPKIAGVGLWNALEPAAARAAFRADIRYIAPEVRAGQPASPRSDVYSVAVILGELALGRFLDGQMVHDQLRERLRRHRPALVKVLGAALSQEPATRFATVAELAGKLALAASGHAMESGAMRASPRGNPQPGDEGVPTTPRNQGGEIVPIRPQIAKAVATPPSERPPQRPVGNGKPRPPSAQPLPPSAAMPTPATPPPAGVMRPSTSGRTPGSAVFLNAGKAPSLRESGRHRRQSGRPQRSAGFHVAVALVCAALTAGIAWVAYTMAKNPGEKKSPKSGGGTQTATGPQTEPLYVPDAAGLAPVPAPPTSAPDAAAATTGLSPCPSGMRLVDAQPSFCIDTYEAPGQGIIPVTNITVEQARLACAQRNRRLCSSDEWERACKGKDGLFYPYGMRYDPKRCNVRDAGKRAIEPAGSWLQCSSPADVYDLSGNVSEWVEEGVTKGGSTTDGEDGRCSRSTRRPPGSTAADIGYRCCAAMSPP